MAERDESSISSSSKRLIHGLKEERTLPIPVVERYTETAVPNGPGRFSLARTRRSAWSAKARDTDFV